MPHTQRSTCPVGSAAGRNGFLRQIPLRCPRHVALKATCRGRSLYLRGTSAADVHRVTEPQWSPDVVSHHFGDRDAVMEYVVIATPTGHGTMSPATSTSPGPRPKLSSLRSTWPPALAAPRPANSLRPSSAVECRPAQHWLPLHRVGHRRR